MADVPVRSRRAVMAFAVFAATWAGSAAWAAEVTISVTDAAGKPLPQAVIAVTVKGQPANAAAGAAASMGQRGRQFAPQVLAVQTGTAVSFPNFDTVRHHVYSVSPVRRFELKLYAGTPAAPVVFDKPGVAVLGCNIHDRMSGWIAVVDTPYVAVTDDQGRAVLDLPAGSHRLNAWHPELGQDGAWTEQALAVAAGPTASAVRLVVTPKP